MSREASKKQVSFNSCFILFKKILLLSFNSGWVVKMIKLTLKNIFKILTNIYNLFYKK